MRGEELRGGGVRFGGEVAGALVRGAVVEAQAAVYLDQLALHVPLLPRRLVQGVDVLRDHGHARVEVGQSAYVVGVRELVGHLLDSIGGRFADLIDSPGDGLVAGVGRAARVCVRKKGKPKAGIPFQGISEKRCLGPETCRLMDACVEMMCGWAGGSIDRLFGFPHGIETHPLDPDGVGVLAPEHRYARRRAEPGAYNVIRRGG